MCNNLLADTDAIDAQSAIANPRKSATLPTAHRFLIIMLAATPALAIAPEALADGVLAIMASIMLALAASAPRAALIPGLRSIKPVLPAFLFPVALMLFQIAPLPFSAITNSIWPTTAHALNESSLTGHISVDLGETLRALTTYLIILSLVVATIVLGKDRHRAESIGLTLSVVTTLIGIEFIYESFLGDDQGLTITLAAVTVLAPIVSGAVIIMAVERHLSRSRKEEISLAPLVVRLSIGVSGVIVALAASIRLLHTDVLIAMTLGCVTLLFIVVSRRFELRPWLSLVLFAGFLGVATGLAVPFLQASPSARFAGFAMAVDKSSAPATARMMTNAPLLGYGAGTFKPVSRAYQDFGAAPPDSPSTAISIAIEWGPLALVLLVLFSLQVVAITFLGSMRRGRDSFYAAAASSCLLLILWEVFCDTSLSNTVVQVISAVIIALGLAQRTSQTGGA